VGGRMSVIVNTLKSMQAVTSIVTTGSISYGTPAVLILLANSPNKELMHFTQLDLKCLRI